MRRTIFFDDIKKMGAFVADFNGWEMPIYVTGIKDEHFAVRNNVGVFDVSHMSFFSIKGDKAIDFLDKLVVTDLKSKKNGTAIYSIICNANGGIIDDVILYKKNNNEFFMMANAGNDEKIKYWFEAHNDLKIKMKLEDVVVLAIQGPGTIEAIKKIFSINNAYKIFKLGYYNFCELDDMVVARTGYTGEIGFEFVIPKASKNVTIIWEKIKAFNIKICGLGARDILRLEAGYPLYGHEMNDEITPFEAGLGNFVGFDKSDFIGKQVLLDKMSRLSRRLVGIKLDEKRLIPRHGTEIYSEGKKIGFVTSGSYSFFLEKTLAFGLVEQNYSDLGHKISLLIRNNFIDTLVVKKRFYYNPAIKNSLGV